MNGIILFLLLFSTWLVFSGFFNFFFLSVGAVSCFISVLISIKTKPNNYKTPSLFGVLFRFPLYLFWLIKEVVKSSLDVTIKMWQLDPNISPKIGWISTDMKDDISLTVFGGSITLTPGTVTSDVKPDGMVQVHALNKESLTRLQRGYMSNNVVDLMGLDKDVGENK